MIPFGPWRPDVGGPNSGFAQTADSVLPQAAPDGIGYGPMAGLSVSSGADALSGAPRGLISLQAFNGGWKLFAATATTIEEMDSAYQWSDIETGRTVTAGEDVSFLHFGSYLLNTDTTDGFKAYNVEVPAGNNAVSGAPAAKSLFSSNNVVFALSCDGNTRRMQSSALGDHTQWRTGGADGKTFEDGGALVCGRDLTDGAAVIWQEDAMRLITFGTAPNGALYGVKKIAGGKGSVGERSVVAFDTMTFFLATDGFYKFTLGGGNEPIGAEKVNRWFFRNVSTTDMAEVQATVDPFNKVVWWRVSDTQLLGYDWQINEFFTAAVSTSFLTRIATPALTYATITGTYADQVFTYGSRGLQGGAPVFGALDSSYKFGTFSGSSLAATLETCRINSPTKDLIRWVTPVDDATDGSLQVGASPTMDAALTWGTGATKNSSTDQRTQQRVRGSDIAFRRNIPAAASWTFANGVDQIDSSPGTRK